MKLESLNNQKFEILEKSQLSYVNGGEYARTEERYYNLDGSSIPDREEYFIKDGVRNYTGVTQLQNSAGVWMSERQYWNQ